MSSVSADSNGVAQALVTDFMSKIGSDVEEAAQFYGEDAVLNFKGRVSQGRDAIRSFLQTKQGMSLDVAAWDVQSVPGSDSWTMVVVMGRMTSDGRNMPFHSAFYVESRSDDNTAFIRYHMFN